MRCSLVIELLLILMSKGRQEVLSHTHVFFTVRMQISLMRLNTYKKVFNLFLNSKYSKRLFQKPGYTTEMFTIR
jgi:hypothetical protein